MVLTVTLNSYKYLSSVCVFREGKNSYRRHGETDPNLSQSSFTQTETVAPVIKDSADKSLLYIKLKKHLIKKHSHPCSHSVLCLTFEDTAVVENAYGKHIKF